ncbi:MAG: 30S ribosomal protein S12 methylthiotransferase RimO [Armatimonadota bacterium]|jgi:ribosomal protein S12 methylthiotransferase|nr:30S ribosomal protein S12 methylthiotransferase RimO [Fimbriimonadaceae bacterium]MCZ8137632.1 30S ribosomal protein S12 methylthiotransferase RimO [Fimbriimonadaceae bacterium]
MADSAPANVRIITLGCAKNEVDSEEIAGVLRQAGHRLDGREPAEITVINTCGFLESAQQESLRVIRQAVAEKGKGKVIVAGCLAQRLGEELARLAPGADAYIGVGQMGRFDEIVQNVFGHTQPLMDVEPPHHRWADIPTRTRSGRPWSAYLKVSEGCDHRCTFCTIPSFRGKHQSKPIERVVEEARHLVKTGAKELNLIAQDVTQYGYDLYREFTLPKLLRELNQVEGVEWIRLLYFYPNRLTDDVIEAMASLEKVVPYIDIPLQHVHPDVLRRMKRPWDGDRYLKVFDKVRAAIPHVAIRTTFIVGFPGETEAEFQTLLDFTKAARLDRVGAFTFSREPGTPSYEMTGQVPAQRKKERYDRLMRAQQPISLAKNREWIGKPMRILVDETRDGWVAGRSFRDAPEIDGWVYAQGEAEPGTFVDVTVTEGQMYDLIGHLEGAPVPGRRPMVPLQMVSGAAPK